MTSTREDAHSTFALSADTATYDLARHQLRTGHPVDPLSIQPEHFINAMPMDYPVAHTDEAFALYAEAAPSPFAAPGAGLTEGPGDAQRAPWSARTALVAIGAVARPAGSDERRPLHLTLAIDCSGSMAQEGGLTRIQLGLAGLIDHLKAEDRLALVAFGDQARVVLPATAGNEHARLLEAVNELTTGGATNVAEGLSLAYQLANESLDSGVESRVVLCTDGGTLVGEGAPAVVARISTYRQRGITLLVLGCGGTAYQAGPLEQLASQGGGQHVFLASDAEARTAFAGRLLPERLAVLARDAKVQVTWNPERVSHYRLIGYEGRRLAHRDFRNDAVAAGQLSGDTQVTALYEVLLVEGASGPLGTAAVRYFDTRMQSQRELSCPLPGSVLTSQPSPRLRLLACAGECAEWLQRGWWSNVHAANAERILAELKRCPQAQARELELLILRAQRLQAQGGQERSLPPGSGQAQDGSR
jgi:Ca-activated chloride channel homolog